MQMLPIAIIPAIRASSINAMGLPDVNRALGEFRIRFLDRDDRVTFTVRQGMVAGGRVGADAGYATLRDAMTDLARATVGDASAAVVLERAGRFYGHTLKGRDLEQGFRAPLRHSALEADARAEVVALRSSDRLDRVRAFVDGAWSHRFLAR